MFDMYYQFFYKNRYMVRRTTASEGSSHAVGTAAFAQLKTTKVKATALGLKKNGGTVKDSAPAGGVVKKKKYKAGVEALAEIRKYQKKEHENVCRKAPFQAREVGKTCDMDPPVGEKKAI